MEKKLLNWNKKQKQILQWKNNLSNPWKVRSKKYTDYPYAVTVLVINNLFVNFKESCYEMVKSFSFSIRVKLNNLVTCKDCKQNSIGIFLVNTISIKDYFIEYANLYVLLLLTILVILIYMLFVQAEKKFMVFQFLNKTFFLFVLFSVAAAIYLKEFQNVYFESNLYLGFGDHDIYVICFIIVTIKALFTLLTKNSNQYIADHIVWSKTKKQVLLFFVAILNFIATYLTTPFFRAIIHYKLGSEYLLQDNLWGTIRRRLLKDEMESLVLQKRDFFLQNIDVAEIKLKFSNWVSNDLNNLVSFYQEGTKIAEPKLNVVFGNKLCFFIQEHTELLNKIVETENLKSSLSVYSVLKHSWNVFKFAVNETLNPNTAGLEVVVTNWAIIGIIFIAFVLIVYQYKVDLVIIKKIICAINSNNMSFATGWRQLATIAGISKNEFNEFKVAITIQDRNKLMNVLIQLIREENLSPYQERIVLLVLKAIRIVFGL